MEVTESGFFRLWAESTWVMLVDSSLLFLIGLALAGLIWLVMNRASTSRFMADRGLIGVLKAALIGIPLPLCSCSVLPVASQLRKSGASRGGVVAFLISTPESGVDSIMLTYSLTDPILTVARPVAAFLAAFAAGAGEIFLRDKSGTIPQADAGDRCCSDCGSAVPDAESRPSLIGRLWSGIRYAYTDLLDDLAPYLLSGFVLAGLVGALIGTDLVNLPESIRTGWLGYVGAIVIGVPLYVCATSSTPLAAVMLASGFSPGAVLAFLLVGPATNLASLAVVGRIIGVWATVRYLVVIVLVAIGSGIVVDQIYSALGMSARYTSGNIAHSDSWLGVVSALFLAFFILYYTAKKIIHRFHK